jgi:hypothetical protein
MATLISRWLMDDNEPVWLINSLIQTVSRLPQLTELAVFSPYLSNIRIPLGVFSDLSKLCVELSETNEVGLFNIYQIAIAIANSPRLRTLDVTHVTPLSDNVVTLPTLGDLFANLTAKNPLRLEQLHLSFVDATVDQRSLPHLKHLTSFHFRVYDEEISRSVWTSLYDNNIKLTDVAIAGFITEETMLYLSSFSGLKRLVTENMAANSTRECPTNALCAEVLPKHVDSLDELVFDDGVKFLLSVPHVLSSLTGGYRLSTLPTQSQL